MSPNYIHTVHLKGVNIALRLGRSHQCYGHFCSEVTLRRAHGKQSEQDFFLIAIGTFKIFKDYLPPVLIVICT